MSEKGLYSPVVRRLITIVLLIGIIGSFLAIYYLIYLPQQRTQFNLHIFRMLHEISSNFKERINNYGTVYSYKSQRNKDDSLLLGRFVERTVVPPGDTVKAKGDTFKLKSATAFDAIVRSSFKGNPVNVNFTSTKTSITQDSVKFIIDTAANKTKSKKPVSPLDTTVSLSEILEPIISVHADEFESFLLIKQLPDSVKDKDAIIAKQDMILYKSEKSDIANINTDSLFRNRNIEAPAISDLNIEGIAYKIFLLPFKLKTSDYNTYVLAGIVSDETYTSQSQSVPMDLLLSLCIVVVVLLLILPFLKIFFLSAEETISIKDVRTIIVVIFIIPLFITLVSSSTWLFLYRAKWTADVLQYLQNNVTSNFYNEIKDNVIQLQQYDSIVMHASNTFDTVDKERSITLYDQQDSNIKLKDVILYPHSYKNFTSLHWMNDNGDDIAAWTLSRIPPTYFRLGDRDYFRDIKYSRGHVLPHGIGDTTIKDSFSIQPVLSRLTGEYTINIATHSNANLSAGSKQSNGTKQDRVAKVVGLSGKMYSVWNTVVPKGFAFCIIDESGKIICHSDTARSLQENIMQESGDSLLIRNAINHKDSTLLNNIDLYEQPVRMLVKPLPGLPYYLITYYNKRGEYLFVLHIIAFAFLCQSTLLLFASLFSYCMMMTDKRASKLLFTPAALNWIRPSADKKYYYIKIIYQCIASLAITYLFAVFYLPNGNNESYSLFMVNAALLLPLFIITGYYIVKRSRDVIVKGDVTGRFLSKQQYKLLFSGSLNILVLYALSICLFYVLQNVLFFSEACNKETNVKTGVWILIGLETVVMFVIAGYNPDYKNKEPHQDESNNNSYVRPFIIALLLTVFLMSILPAITFISYAFRQEKTLQIQSFQLELAKKIQQRRTSLNQLYWKPKLNIKPFTKEAKAYINDLKFDTSKGIYLLNTARLDTLTHFGDLPATNITCSPFYKAITQFLFLPPDHDDFYDNASHNKFYYWHFDDTAPGNELQLLYNNTTDTRDTTSFKISSTIANAHLFNSLNSNFSYLWKLVLLALIVSMVLFYKIIFATVKRIFLIGFFTDAGIKNNEHHIPGKDTLWLQRSYSSISLQEACKNIFDKDEQVNFVRIRNKENEELKKGNGDEVIIQLHLALKDVYEAIWDKCTDAEKYTLYDFATDGFTNYKNIMVLYDLYNKGLIIKERDGHITLMTKSFRNFLITKEGTEEVKRLNSQSKKGSWGTLRTVFYFILIAMAIFIFISQEEASKRLITIITSLGALLPAILKLFDKSTFSTPAASKSDNNG